MQVREVGEQEGILFAEINGQMKFRLGDLGTSMFPYPNQPEGKPNSLAAQAVREFLANHPIPKIDLVRSVSRPGRFADYEHLEPGLRFMQANRDDISRRFFGVVAIQKAIRASKEITVTAPVPTPAAARPLWEDLTDSYDGKRRVERPDAFSEYEYDQVPVARLLLGGGLSIVAAYDGGDVWLEAEVLADMLRPGMKGPGTLVAKFRHMLKGRDLHVRAKGEKARVFVCASQLDRFIEAIFGRKTDKLAAAKDLALVIRRVTDAYILAQRATPSEPAPESEPKAAAAAAPAQEPSEARVKAAGALASQILNKLCEIQEEARANAAAEKARHEEQMTSNDALDRKLTLLLERQETRDQHLRNVLAAI